MKPQVAPDVLQEIAPYFQNTKCLVSICAGLKIETIKQYLGSTVPVIRTMPNTPMLLGMGMTALAASNEVEEETFRTVEQLFSGSGKTLRVEEGQLSAVTAISGSGPAYFFKFARAAVAQGKELGLSEQDALLLLCQTMAGSAKMLMESGKTADELITMVTSPKGTTLAASESFDRNRFEPIICEAIQACYDRAEELSKG